MAITSPPGFVPFFQDFGGQTVAPPVSPAGKVRQYYNLTTNKLMISKNGSAYAEVAGSGVGGAGTLNTIPLFGSGGNVVGDSNLLQSGSDLLTTGKMFPAKLGLGTSSVSTKALLEMVSTSMGFLPPRLTLAQRNAITSPDTGLQLFNSTTGQWETYNGAAWQSSALFVDAADYGCVPDTGADMASALSAALASGKVPKLRQGTYKINSPITYTATTKVTGLAGEPGTIIDNTSWALGGAGVPYITFQGSKTSVGTLNATVAAGAKIIVFAVDPGLVQGDIIELNSTGSSPETFNGITGHATYIKGEFAEVLSDDGSGNVTLKDPLCDGYTVATTVNTVTVYKMVMPKVYLENIELVANNNHMGFKIAYARDIHVSNCNFHGSRERGLYLLECLGGAVINTNIWDTYYIGTGTSYALSIGSCAHIRILGCYLNGGRHGTHNGGTFPTRYCQWFGCTIDNYHPIAQAAFDTHGNVERITISQCNIMNGILANGVNINVNNNTIVGDTMACMRWEPESQADYLDCSNNKMFGVASDCVLINPLTAAASGPLSIRFNDNFMIGASHCVYINGANSGATTCIFPYLQFKGNYMRNTGAVQCFYIFQNAGTVNYTFNNLKISDGVIISEAHDAFYIQSAVQSGKITFDNMVMSNGHAGYVLRVASGLGDITVNNCYLFTAFSGSTNVFGGNGTLVIRDTTIEGFTSNSGLSSGALMGDVILDNVRFVACTGSVSSATASRIVNGVSHLGGGVSWMTLTGSPLVAPATTGTYMPGDTVFPTNPAVGSPAFFSCVTGGTRGTLSSVTATTTGQPTKTVTVNTVAGLVPGAYITIVGVTGTKRIVSIDPVALTITIDTNATANVSGAVVAYGAPVFGAAGNLA